VTYDDVTDLTDDALKKELFFAERGLDGTALTKGWLVHLQNEQARRDRPRALPHLYPGAARWTVRPTDCEDNFSVGLFWSQGDAEAYARRAGWDQFEALELVFPSPELVGGHLTVPLLYAGPTTDVEVADAPPNPEEWS